MKKLKDFAKLDYILEQEKRYKLSKIDNEIIKKLNEENKKEIDAIFKFKISNFEKKQKENIVIIYNKIYVDDMLEIEKTEYKIKTTKQKPFYYLEIESLKNDYDYKNFFDSDLWELKKEVLEDLEI